MIFAASFILISVTNAAPQAVKLPYAEPSFSCVGALSPTEEAICADAELRAYDSAMHFAYTRKWSWMDRRWSTQRKWLAYRNKCGADRGCVLAAYKQWLEGLDPVEDVGSPLPRVAGPPDEGGDLMLGSLQSPTGEVTNLKDTGELFIQPLGEDWYFFKAFAVHAYDPHDGLGANASTSGALGLVHLTHGIGRFVDDPQEEMTCTLQITKLPDGAWKLDEEGDSCSGIGSSLTGIYRR